MIITFQSVLQLTLCMLALAIMIGYVGFCCHLLHTHARGDMTRGHDSVPIVVYTRPSEDGVFHGMENPTLAPAMNRPPAEVPETSNNTDTARTYVV